MNENEERKMIFPVELAIIFHNAYETLAPDFGYETRDDTKKFDPKSKNGRLMIATCEVVLEHLKKHGLERPDPGKDDFQWASENLFNT